MRRRTQPEFFTLIHALIDALGNPFGFFLTGGHQAHDLIGADHLLPTMQADTLLVNEAFDADERVPDVLAAAGKTPRDYDKELYQARHLTENFFAKLKQIHAIATRYDKTARSFLAGVHLAASAIWLI